MKLIFSKKQIEIFLGENEIYFKNPITKTVAFKNLADLNFFNVWNADDENGWFSLNNRAIKIKEALKTLIYLNIVE